MDTKRIWLWITIAVLIAGGFVALWFADHGAVSNNATQAPIVGTARVGEKAPEIALATDQGYFDLAKAHKPVFLEVFATWCPHCQREAAVIDRLYEQYKKRVDFVGVSGSDTGMAGYGPSGERDVMNFASTFHVSYPVAYDGSLQVAKEYLQGGYPTLVVIGRNKIVRYITSGETPYAALAQPINAALKS
jgi:cytochrome c biogenesis protein CcmG/thiol:disulfide interchange protein DsbE